MKSGAESAGTGGMAVVHARRPTGAKSSGDHGGSADVVAAATSSEVPAKNRRGASVPPASRRTPPLPAMDRASPVDDDPGMTDTDVAIARLMHAQESVPAEDSSGDELDLRGEVRVIGSAHSESEDVAEDEGDIRPN